MVLCFVVDPQLRRHGVARALLDYALHAFETRGLRIVDAFPTIRGTGGALPFSSLSPVIGVMAEDRHRPVDLFRRHDADELVRPGHGPKR